MILGNSTYLFAQNKVDTTSYVHTLDIQTGRIDTLWSAKAHFEAPNWHPDNYLVLNSKGKYTLLTLPLKNEPTQYWLCDSLQQ
jgi:hypothetical protein